MLQRTPHFKMHSNLLDSHVYIVSRWVLDYMQEHLKNALSFKREVLPHLLKNQDSKILLQFSERFHDDIDKLASQYSSSPIPSPTQCHAHTITGAELCTRVNTVSLYMEANRMIGQHSSSFMLDSGTSGQGIKSSAISGDSVVDESTQLSDKVSVKRSMIGRHCVIGEKVKVINSVIMDHVVIGESCTIQNSILCNQVRLEEKATLKDCTVGPRVTINSKAEHKGELLVEDSELDL
ncbi:PREDICTED: translation initiation factor eIF-2B subunit gamma-like [Amphimedon queenslandica]|uniref:Translation initiation factor eIF2B subunit gamma n=2 Tax=Amphimedon queenslandica TaxID=400682 RepID=A0AAN0IP57_AMPQE|nr:PREDICTED: translation initiation factor eIF-2B subunit gamma-like [Amphimedon queenslandica]|eukprot:XP_011405789.2 PREDICTED: translation initiation factor eIF-2B subunit gamma-like [Amphimedon queenslandica]